ncbi:MAG: hypothetical protein HOC71_12650, partial [Candidatus Latescibacteria bacterium]|nr:hypothetical protein [Candidatus Latescibacterota bacterium]
DLPLSDGGRVRAHFPNPPINQWIEVDYSIDDILSASEYSTFIPVQRLF